MQETNGEVTGSGLIRTIGVTGLAASIVNLVIGAGIFVLPASVAAEMGSAGWLAFLACALAVAPVVLAFAEAGSRVSDSGGPYGYVGAAFGPLPGFLAGVLLWLSGLLASAGITAGVADLLGGLLPVLHTPVMRAVLIAVVYFVLAMVNIRGVRTSTRLVEVMTVAKVASLVLFIGIGVFLVRGANLAWPASIPEGGFGRAVATVIFAFAGWETALATGGEVRNPARTVPRALMLAMAAVALLYIAIQAIAQGVLGGALATSAAPLADALAGSPLAGGELVLVGSFISMLGYVAGDLLGSPRVLFAFARDGLLPRPVAYVHPEYHVPHVAIVVHAVVACGLALSGTFAELALLSGLTASGLYFAGSAASLVLRRRGVATVGEPFRLPGGVLIPVLAMLSMGWLIAQAHLAEVLALAAALAAATGLYYFQRRIGGR